MSDLKEMATETPPHAMDSMNSFLSSFRIVSDEERKRLDDEEREVRCQNYFYRKVPEDFREPIDRTRKTVDWRAFDRILGWDGKKSITARGPSQLGKTRAIYQALMAEVRRSGKRFKVIDEFELIAKVSDAASENKLVNLGKLWAQEDVLFFDDIDKVNFGQGVTGKNALTLVFGVIKSRMANRKPTILSYNLSIGDFFAEAGVHTVNSLIERIKQKEHWMSVEFKQPEP